MIVSAVSFGLDGRSEPTMSYQTNEIGRAIRDSLLPGVGAVIAVVAARSPDPLEVELVGPFLVAAALCLMMVALRWSNARTRIAHHRDPDRPPPNRAPTPSWTPYGILLAIVVPAQAGLNYLYWPLGDGLVGFLLVVALLAAAAGTVGE